MPNDERILETMPTGTLGLIPTASCMELGEKSRQLSVHLEREHREHEHHNDIAFKEYHKEKLHHSLVILHTPICIIVWPDVMQAMVICSFHMGNISKSPLLSHV